MAKMLIAIGAVILAIGLVLLYFPQALNWLGRLPGDIRIEREHGTFYFPLTTMVIISIVLSIIAYLFRR